MMNEFGIVTISFFIVRRRVTKAVFPVYQINAYIQDADKMTSIYSDLHQNIQDYFDKASVEILSPHYTAFRNGNASTIPKEKPATD